MCLSCGKKLDTVERHPSALECDEDNEVLIRHDYCEECWERIKEQPYYCQWMTRRIPKVKESGREQRRTAREHAMKLFEQTVATPDATNRSARLYILAHLLLRLRAFKWVGNRVDPETHKPVLVFEEISSGEKVYIPHVKLNEEELSEAQRFVDVILNTGKNRPESLKNTDEVDTQ